jgi:hypothetical protein
MLSNTIDDCAIYSGLHIIFHEFFVLRVDDRAFNTVGFLCPYVHPNGVHLPSTFGPVAHRDATFRSLGAQHRAGTFAMRFSVGDKDDHYPRTWELYRHLADAGADALGLDWTCDLGDARRRVDDRVALQGNFDPMALFATPEAVAAEARAVLDSSLDEKARGAARAGPVRGHHHRREPHVQIERKL